MTDHYYQIEFWHITPFRAELVETVDVTAVDDAQALEAVKRRRRSRRFSHYILRKTVAVGEL